MFSPRLSNKLITQKDTKMNNFHFYTPTEIFFGQGQIRNLGRELVKQGATKVLVLYGSDRIKKSGLFAQVEEQLGSVSLPFTSLGGIEPNPRIDSVREGIRIAREFGADFLLPVGGGSVIDAAKAMAAGFYYPGDPWDVVQGKKEAKVKEALPLAAILTIAATGTEMNGNSVISNLETVEKLGLSSDLIIPKFSILDPEYTSTLPPFQTAAGVADIMSHIWEQYFSPTEHTEIQDRLSEALLLTCIEWGPVAVKDPENYHARSNILWASTLALNGLLSAGRGGDWATHMMEHALSAVTDVTHGAGLAILFPNWMSFVLQESNVQRFIQLATRVWGIDPTGKSEMQIAQEGIEATRAFLNSLGLPATLKEIGAEEKDLDIMAQKSLVWGPPMGDFGQLDLKGIREIFQRAYV
jgi:alcohol dehydrogenase YqhD (iron-dependent ADH family)